MWQQGRKSRSQKRTRQPQWRAQTARGIRQCCRRCHKSVLASRQASKFARWFPSTLRNSQAACQALPACCLTIPHAGQLGMYVCHNACSTLQVYSALMTALHVLEMYCGLMWPASWCFSVLCGFVHTRIHVCVCRLFMHQFTYKCSDCSCELAAVQNKPSGVAEPPLVPAMQSMPLEQRCINWLFICTCTLCRPFRKSSLMSTHAQNRCDGGCTDGLVTL